MSRNTSDVEAAGKQTTASEDEMGVHYGKLLWHVALTYPSLALTIVEMVQNGIDAGATEIFVGVDLREARAFAADNGRGVTVETFRKALKSVGDGIKEPGSLGRFGLGMISPITNCVCMTFASRPEGSDEVTQWTFVGETIKQNREAPKIPNSKLRDLPRLPEPFRSSQRKWGAGWRTVISLSQIHDDIDNFVDVEDLKGKISDALGSAMRVTGTTVHLMIRDKKGHVTKGQVDPLQYDGEPLEVVTYETPETGRVVFELYRARKRKGGPDGKVGVQELMDVPEDAKHLPYLVAWRNFRMQAMGLGWLDTISDAFNALGSGVFEGVIKIEKVEINPERTKFVANNALLGAYTLIAQWYEEHGKTYIENEREAEQERRYQELGERTLERLSNLLANNTKFGRLALKLQSLLPPASKSGVEAGPGSPTKKEGERKKRLVVQSPRPRERNPRSPLSGMIKFAYEMLPQSRRLWEYDPEQGILTFNIRHPVWVSVDEINGKRTPKTDRQVMQLQEWITIELLELLSRRPDPKEFEEARDIIESKAPLYVELSILSH